MINDELSEHEVAIKAGIARWQTIMPPYLQYGDVRVQLASCSFKNGELTTKWREVEGHINGISHDGMCIVLERNPDKKDRKRPFLGTYWVPPERVISYRIPGTMDWALNSWRPPFRVWELLK